MNTRRILLSLLVVVVGLETGAVAQSQPPTLTFTAPQLKKMFGAAATLAPEADAADGRVCELPEQARGESYDLGALKPGWYAFILRVRTLTPPPGDGGLAFAFWNPINQPNSFRYETTFPAREFPPVGQFGTLRRVMHVGERGAKYGMTLKGGWKGLQLETMRYEGLNLGLKLEAVRTEKLLYGLKEPGTVQVFIQNGADRPEPAHLTVTVSGGLDGTATLYDADVVVPAPEKPGRPAMIEAPLPAQEEYGHAVTAVLKQGTTELGSVSDYFYVSDRPQTIGHLGYMGIGSSYNADGAQGFVDSMRRHYIPMYEIGFWAPDDTIMLTSPPGKDRWWSGQTLAASTTQSMKARVKLGHDQGMKVLGYTNLLYDFGFRTAEFFRKNPEYCNWDANDTSLAFGVEEIQRQTREDDKERFADAKMRKPRWSAQGIWALATGNPAMVDYHIDQLVSGAKEFGFDGWRYDDAYRYDYPMVDLLGHQLPYPGFNNAALLARLRGALAKVKPGMIYGHNMEWSQDCQTEGPPMSQTAQARPGDYYTEFLRDGGLHLQERWTAQMVGNHAKWEDVEEYLWRCGYNAYRFGGAAYSIGKITSARPADARCLTALYLAGMNHIAYDVQDDQIGYMRLACRFSDLLYGEKLVQLTEPEKTLAVDSGDKPVWWRRYVRYREVEPGHRLYLVHLINPPRNAKIGEGDPKAPDPLTNVTLRWTLPDGWQPRKAYVIAGEGGTGIESAVSKGGWYTTTDIVGRDLVQKPLPCNAVGDVREVVVPSVDVWSMVVLDCTGPKTDAAPAPMALPPTPAVPAEFAEPSNAKDIRSQDSRGPLVYDAERIWTGLNAEAKKAMPKEQALATDGEVRALRLSGPMTAELYNPGEAIQGGSYRFSFRLRSTVAPPAGATLEFSAWCPPNRPKHWRVDEQFSLAGLTPDKGWQTFTRDVQMGFGWENFGVQLREGFPGLQIASFQVESVRILPDSKRIELQDGAPWPADQQRAARRGLRVWYGEGLYYEKYQIAESLKRIDGVTLDESPEYVWRDRRGFSGSVWKTPGELAAYDLVVINNIDLKTFSLEQRSWLRGYVETGGAVWFVGGPYGFGRGFWQESDLLEPLFPVKMHAYDLRPDGIPSPQELTTAPGASIVTRWPEKPSTLWLHETELKAGARAHLLAGKFPALASWQVGKGRVVALLVTPLGDERDLDNLWWKSNSWPDLMEKTGRWLLKQ
jgi:hypothetical protein